MSDFDRDIAALYGTALRRLRERLFSSGISPADRELIRAALARLHAAYANVARKDLAVRAAELNTLAATLHTVLGRTTSVDDIEPLRAAAHDARSLLVRVAREAFPDASPDTPDDRDPDVSQAPDESAAVPSPYTGEQFAESRVPTEYAADYRARFAACVVRPEQLALANGYVERMFEGRDRYARAGDALRVPWWFIGAIHALESGFAFDRHLHNGDPLSARTRRVPAGRPPDGEPPFTWEHSATDALRYKKLERWGDWSVAGALYQWEAYNGFGYRERGVPSPYLWSFSNHYTRGRYVRDHVFNPDAVSNQCGAAVMLRILVNRGVVIVEV